MGSVSGRNYIIDFVRFSLYYYFFGMWRFLEREKGSFSLGSFIFIFRDDFANYRAVLSGVSFRFGFVEFFDS